MVFDAVAAFSQAEEQELAFLEPPVEYQKMCNKPVLWQCLKVSEGRRNGARSWQDHFHECMAGSRGVQRLRVCITAESWTSRLISTLMTVTRQAKRKT